MCVTWEDLPDLPSAEPITQGGVKTFSHNGRVYRYRLVLNSQRQRFVHRFLPRAYAQTVGNEVHVDDQQVHPKVLKHEEAHILQEQHLGKFGYAWRYLALLVRYRYDGHPMEEWARWYAGQKLRRMAEKDIDPAAYG